MAEPTAAAAAAIGFTEPKLVLKKFGRLAGGWRVDRHPRCAADTTGDGRADIVGFGGDGVWVAYARSDGGFDPPQLVLRGFGYNAGWRVERHPRLLADTTGDGRADIVGFFDDGVWVAYATSGGGFKSPQLVLKQFGYGAAAGGWQEPLHPRHLADTNGDGRADIVGFGNAGVWVSRAKKDGGFEAPRLVHDKWGADGWMVDRDVRCVGDTSGDGRADIVGFGFDRVVVSRGDGTGFDSGKTVLKQFGYAEKAGDWRVKRHPRLLADVTGDRRADIVGFGNDGVWVSRSRADGGFDLPRLVMKRFGYAAHADGWRVELHPRCLADTTGDRRADIVGFGDAGVYVSRAG